MKEGINKLANWVTVGIILLYSTACSNNSSGFGGASKEPLDLVNPYIGSLSSYGQPTPPLIHLPHGMLRVSPCKKDFADIYVMGLPIANANPQSGTSIRFFPLDQASAKEEEPRLYFDNESITPYNYSLELGHLGIETQFSLSEWSGIYQLNYKNAKDEERIFRFVADNEACSFALDSTGHLNIVYPLPGTGRTQLYLYLDCNVPLSLDTLSLGSSSRHFMLRAPAKSNKIILKYGLSLISMEQAHRNLRREIPDYEYNIVLKRARNTWHNSLNRIEVEGGTPEMQRILYSALYRTLSVPICISEDGYYYSAYDDSVYHDEGIPYYTCDLLQETYTTLHPLKALIYPDIEENMINSYVKMSKVSPTGTFPAYPSFGGDIATMGEKNRALETMVGSLNRGITDIDIQMVFKAALNYVSWYKADAYDLHAFNRIAKRSGHSDAQIALLSDTLEREKLTPDSIAALLTPYNIEELLSATDTGVFEAGIDKRIEAIMAQPLSIENLYNYYLYAYTSNQDKSSRLLRNIVSNYFRNDPNGMPLSRSSAAMGAAIVFTMLGIYPVSPHEGYYIVGSPSFNKVRINRGTGNVFKIDVENLSPDTRHICRIQLNGRHLEGYKIPHNKLTQGGVLTIEQGSATVKP